MYRQRRFFQNQRPPLKTNMELEITPLEKEKHRKKPTTFGVQRVSLRGLYSNQKPIVSTTFCRHEEEPEPVPVPGVGPSLGMRKWWYPWDGTNNNQTHIHLIYI